MRCRGIISTRLTVQLNSFIDEIFNYWLLSLLPAVCRKSAESTRIIRTTSLNPHCNWRLVIYDFNDTHVYKSIFRVCHHLSNIRRYLIKQVNKFKKVVTKSTRIHETSYFPLSLHSKRLKCMGMYMLL